MSLRWCVFHGLGFKIQKYGSRSRSLPMENQFKMILASFHACSLAPNYPTSPQIRTQNNGTAPCGSFSAARSLQLISSHPEQCVRDSARCSGAGFRRTRRRNSCRVYFWTDQTAEGRSSRAGRRRLRSPNVKRQRAILVAVGGHAIRLQGWSLGG